MKSLLAAAGAAFLFIAAAGPGSADAAPGVAAFCAVHRNRDDPGPIFFGPTFKPGDVPPAVAKAGANSWRCMDGRVWVCLVGADGRRCAKLLADSAPSEPVRGYCSSHPGADFVPMYVIGQSASTWRCRGAMPERLHTETLDARGFVKKYWRVLLVP